jgi:hypothetical protein
LDMKQFAPLHLTTEDVSMKSSQHCNTFLIDTGASLLFLNNSLSRVFEHSLCSRGGLPFPQLMFLLQKQNHWKCE